MDLLFFCAHWLLQCLRTEDLGSLMLKRPVSVVYMVITTEVPKMKQTGRKYVEIQIIYHIREYLELALSFIMSHCFC